MDIEVGNGSRHSRNNSALMHKDMKWLANYYLRCKRIA